MTHGLEHFVDGTHKVWTPPILVIFVLVQLELTQHHLVLLHVLWSLSLPSHCYGSNISVVKAPSHVIQLSSSTLIFPVMTIAQELVQVGAMHQMGGLANEN